MGSRLTHLHPYVHDRASILFLSSWSTVLPGGSTQNPEIPNPRSHQIPYAGIRCSDPRRQRCHKSLVIVATAEQVLRLMGSVVVGDTDAYPRWRESSSGPWTSTPRAPKPLACLSSASSLLLSPLPSPPKVDLGRKLTPSPTPHWPHFKLCMIVAATTRFKADNFGPMFIPPGESNSSMSHVTICTCLWLNLGFLIRIVSYSGCWFCVDSSGHSREREARYGRPPLQNLNTNTPFIFRTLLMEPMRCPTFFFWGGGLISLHFITRMHRIYPSHDANNSRLLALLCSISLFFKSSNYVNAVKKTSQMMPSHQNI